MLSEPFVLLRYVDHPVRVTNTIWITLIFIRFFFLFRKCTRLTLLIYNRFVISVEPHPTQSIHIMTDYNNSVGGRRPAVARRAEDARHFFVAPYVVVVIGI